MSLRETYLCVYFCIYACINAGTFDSRIVEYREEMSEFSSSLRQNVKNVGKKIKEFFVESGLSDYFCLFMVYIATHVEHIAM